MKKQRKSSGSLYQDYLPLYFRGDNQIFNYMQLKFEAIINFQKQHIISLPLKTFSVGIQDFIQPLAQIQTIDELSRQSMLKNKSLIKEGIFYVYFPSNIRVDQKIFKIYDKNYQSFIKDVPKNFRMNFAKFIIWEQGTGDQNINNQKQKLQQLFSNCIKLTIQKKLQEFTKQIATLQSLQLNQRVLRSLFVGRNKLASIYRQLRLTSNTCEHLSNLFNDILYNFKKFLAPSSTKQISVQKTQYKSPFIIKDINKIFGFFDSKSTFLHITNFCFMRMFQSHLELLQHFDAIVKFKQYLDFIMSNILNLITSRQDDISRNIWLIDTIDQVYKILKQKSVPAILNPQKQQDYSLLNVKICSQYRNAIQRLGMLFYGLNTYIVFPRSLQYELKLCIKSMKNQPLTDQQYPEMKIQNRHQQVNKLLFLSGEPINQTIEAILNNFQTYKLVYVKTLELVQKTLSQSPYKKVSWSMKLSVLKATIIYFTLKDQKRMSISSLLQENKNFSYEAKKSVWQKLQIINKVYQLTLCKRYNIKMRVQDLLNIILDDSIIHLQNIWIQLVNIVSQLLFQYKKGQSEQQAQRLNCIDYGEQGDQDDGLVIRKRRRTTIHYDLKKIEVGTMKFISLVDNIEMAQNQEINQQFINQTKNDIIRLNIQLSNRIISYALALIQKSKTRSKTNQLSNQKPLIQLKFVIKILNGQQKIIPFEITQTQDKFIEVQIKSKQVMIFTIQKLLIDITDSITLLYTMPINHQKIQFYDKKGKNIQQQQDYYVNISPQLKINTLLLFQPTKTQNKTNQDLKYRKQSTSSLSSKPNSQSSASGANYVIYQKLWNPFKFMFSFNSNDQIQIQKIQIQCQDDINDKIFVGQQQMHLKQLTGYKVTSNNDQYVFPLIIFIKSSEKSETNKQSSNYFSAAKRHKQSINILPKSLRNRTQSFARSIASGPGSNMSIDSNRVSIKLHLKHNQYSYQIKKQISYCKKSPFKVQYRYSQQFEEYTVKNLTQEQLQIVSQEDCFELYPYQQLKVFSSIVKICLKYQEEDIQSESDEQNFINLMRFLKLDEKVDLKTMIKKQHLKPQKISTIWLNLQQLFKDKDKQIYSVFEPIRIWAQESGYISVLKWNSSQYQLVGKVEGLIQFANQKENKGLELFLIPTKKGSISLPQISINSKKGVWKNGKRIKIG